MSAMASLSRPTRTRATSSTTRSSRGRAGTSNMEDHTMSPGPVMRYFDPAAATSTMFLYAQGNSIVCCHHDTLTIERRFSRHSDEVQLLAVDNQSEVGAGRLVVSYDIGQTAIVWDLMSGDEVARFASYEHFTTAAWMRSGNVAFGNTQGNIILFEPTTSEHISTRTLDQIAVTALAPAADNRTFAIGYQNGSLLIATLQPRFTILHNLTTSRGPSPIVMLNWHASSSRQKSDMLSVQTNDGDLRVWSVAKSHNAADPAKVVRILRKTENYIIGANWSGWSKNGRIIQYTENETLSWDVRTKHVTFDNIPTMSNIKGMALYGPSATLFTLGANNTVQQYDLNAPAQMTINVQHPANLLPPSPPVSIEEQDKGATSSSEAEVPISADISESEGDDAGPMDRIARAGGQGGIDDPYQISSPTASSSASDLSSTSSRTPGRYQESLRSRGLTDNTYISMGSSIRTSNNTPPQRDSAALSTVSLSTISMSSSTSQNASKGARPSRLRNEIPRSPEDSKVVDLFKFTRSRLSDVPYKGIPNSENSRLTNDDLRRQMLSIIFGWNREVDELVRDEMSRHPVQSPSRILLAKWLGDINPDIMTTSSENMTSSDWMLLALSGIGGTAAQYKLGRAYVQRLLESGDVHSAATIMIGMGDQNDAIEIYVSHKKYLEALIVTCLFFPGVWERQAQIIKKWGDWAVQHGHRQLAIRCFACTGKESSEPWTSPSAQQVTFQSIGGIMNPGIPEVLSPPLSPPGMNRGPQRSIAKTSALKLITSFGDQSEKSRFYTGNDGGQTPMAASNTPIVETAIPRDEDMTAFIRPSNRSTFNTPTTTRSQASNFSRGRLPSIGEMPSDAANARNLARALDKYTVPPSETSSIASTQMSQMSQMTRPLVQPAVPAYAADVNLDVGSSLQRAATASPMMMRDQQRRKEAPPPSPSPESLVALMSQGRSSRNGPRARIPTGIDMHIEAPVTQPGVPGDVTSPEPSVTASARYHWPSRRRGPGSVASSVTSASMASHASKTRGRNPGKSLDDYINSLEATKAQNKGRKTRDSSRTRKAPSREASTERGRAIDRGYTPKGGKRSPRSPVPMSPEDLLNLSTPRLYDLEHEEYSIDPSTARKTSTVRHASRSRTRRGDSRDRKPAALDLSRSRSNTLEHPNRSPTSPIPLPIPTPQFYNSEDEEDYKRAIEDKERFRSKKTASRTSNSARRELSPRSVMARATAADKQRVQTPALRIIDDKHAGDLKAMKDERQLKKEAAARELEQRRRSLAQRPHASSIGRHEDAANIVRAPTAFELPSTTFVPPKHLPPRSHTAEPRESRSMYAQQQQSMRPHVGLPATPKAMRLVPEVSPDETMPPVPITFAQANSPSASPKEEKRAAPPGLDSLLTLAPTVYQPPVRPGIPRSMSAPPVEPRVPAALAGHGPSPVSSRNRGQSMRKTSSPEHTEENSRGHVRATSQDRNSILPSSSYITSRRQSRDHFLPPPPPPPPSAPPAMLPQLAHLAMPPPPPPAPLQMAHSQPQYNSSGIEIVPEDESNRNSFMPVAPPPPPAPFVPYAMSVAQPLSEAVVPIIAAPAPPSSRQGHHRGRSSVDIAGRISRATERMRSASRTRQSSSVVHGPQRIKSPEINASAPYESVQILQQAPPMTFSSRPEISSPIQTRMEIPHNLPTGLNPTDMI